MAEESMTSILTERYKGMSDYELQELLVRGGLTAEAESILGAEIRGRKAKGSFQPSVIVTGKPL